MLHASNRVTGCVNCYSIKFARYKGSGRVFTSSLFQTFVIEAAVIHHLVQGTILNRWLRI